MKKRTLSLLLSIACVLSLSLSACGNGTAAPSLRPSAPVDTETPGRRGGSDPGNRLCRLPRPVPRRTGRLLRLHVPGNLGTLITKDENNKPAPALATSWEHNEDATVWTFYLREGVTFSNGTPFNADIVLPTSTG